MFSEITNQSDQRETEERKRRKERAEREKEKMFINTFLFFSFVLWSVGKRERERMMLYFVLDGTGEENVKFLNYDIIVRM